MTATLSLSEHKGKLIDVVLTSHPDEAKTYKVEEAAGEMVILREKGKSSPDLVSLTDIVSWTPPAPKDPAPLKAKRLKPVEADKVKRHLLDAHGYQVATINPLTEAEAVALHDSIDHKELDLGHWHGLPKAAEAIAEDGPSSDAGSSEATAAPEVAAETAELSGS